MIVPRLIANRWECPDGTILHSKYRHDFVEHGEHFVDGGNDYARVTEGLIDRCIYSDDPFELQREFFVWGSYGKNGDEDRHWIALKDLTTEHIYAILATQWYVKGTYIEELFKQELEWRNA